MVEYIHVLRTGIVDLGDLLHLEQGVKREDLTLVAVDHPDLVEHGAEGDSRNQESQDHDDDYYYLGISVLRHLDFVVEIRCIMGHCTQTTEAIRHDEVGCLLDLGCVLGQGNVFGIKVRSL